MSQPKIEGWLRRRTLSEAMMNLCVMTPIHLVAGGVVSCFTFVFAWLAVFSGTRSLEALASFCSGARWEISTRPVTVGLSVAFLAVVFVQYARGQMQEDFNDCEPAENPDVTA